MEKIACLHCGRTFDHHLGPGRPRRYCSTRCRSAAERRRMRRRLALGKAVEAAARELVA